MAAAVSEKASDAHGGWECYQEPELIESPRWVDDPPRGSHYWAAATVGQLRQMQVLESGIMDDSVPVSVKRTEWLAEQLKQSQTTWSSYLLSVNAQASGEAAQMAESAAQADMLREIFGNPFMTGPQP